MNYLLSTAFATSIFLYNKDEIFDYTGNRVKKSYNIPLVSIKECQMMSNPQPGFEKEILWFYYWNSNNRDKYLRKWLDRSLINSEVYIMENVIYAIITFHNDRERTNKWVSSLINELKKFESVEEEKNVKNNLEDIINKINNMSFFEKYMYDHLVSRRNCQL